MAISQSSIWCINVVRIPEGTHEGASYFQSTNRYTSYRIAIFREGFARMYRISPSSSNFPGHVTRADESYRWESRSSVHRLSDHHKSFNSSSAAERRRVSLAEMECNR